MPAVSLPGVFNTQNFTSTGALAALHRLYTYAPGTTTQKDAYTDPAGTVAHTYTADGLGGQYIALDARGELPAPLFLQAGGYDLTLKTPAGVTIWTRRAYSQDDATNNFADSLADAADADIGANLVGFNGALAYDDGTVGGLLVQYFGRTTAETTAGVTPTHYGYPPGDVRRYGAAGDYAGTPGAGTDDSSAIRNAFLVVQAAGGGRIDFGSRRYRIFSNGSTGALADLSSCRGVVIESQGAELVVDRTFSGVETIQLFQFTACSGISFGDFTASCTQTQAAGSRTARGAVFAKFLQGCEGVTSRSLTITDLRMGWYPFRDTGDPVSYVSRNFDLGVTYATRVGYPLTTVRSGYGLRARLHTYLCGRSFFPQGIQDADVWVRSKDHEASADVLIATEQGEGAYGLRLHYVNRESTVADNSLDCVRVEFQDGDVIAGTHREIDVSLDIETTDSAWLGFGFALGKRKADDTADAVDRGHTLSGLRISGSIRGGSGGAANQRSVALCNVGTWSTGEFVSGIDVDGLRVQYCSQPSFNLASLLDVARLRGLISDVTVNVTTGAAGAGVVDLTSYKVNAWSITGSGTVRYDGSLRGSKTFDPPNLIAGSTQQTTVTVNGAAVGDMADCSFSVANAGMLWIAEVTGSDTVTVTQWNITGGAIDLASGTLRASVWKAV